MGALQGSDVSLPLAAQRGVGERWKRARPRNSLPSSRPRDPTSLCVWRSRTLAGSVDELLAASRCTSGHLEAVSTSDPGRSICRRR